MNKLIIAKLEHEFSKKRKLAFDLASEAKDKAMSNAQFCSVEKKISAQILTVAQALYKNENADTEQTILKRLEAEREQILNKMQLSSAHLQPQYQCKNCNDTGWQAQKRCSCFQNQILGELSKRSNFSQNELSLSTCCCATPQNQIVFDKLKLFLEKFESTRIKNILMYGKTGTGKTMLLNCLANDLMKQGYSVFFVTAFALNNLFLNIHLSKIEDKQKLFATMLNADIVIVDDLGSEQLYKNVTVEMLFSLLNERLSSGKSTFVSSNLDPTELLEKYGDRVFSRLGDKKVTLFAKLQGADQRVKGSN